jgi:hypothetical protein
MERENMEKLEERKTNRIIGRMGKELENFEVKEQIEIFKKKRLSVIIQYQKDVVEIKKKINKYAKDKHITQQQAYCYFYGLFSEMYEIDVHELQRTTNSPSILHSVYKSYKDEFDSLVNSIIEMG